MVNKLVHLDADSETTKESSVVPNEFFFVCWQAIDRC